MSDKESIAYDVAYSEAMAEIAEEKIRNRIENLENDLYWATHTGPEAASMKRTQTAIDFWRPYQKEFRTQVAEGKSKAAARRSIRRQIQKDKSWPPDRPKDSSEYVEPSDATLRNRLK